MSEVTEAVAEVVAEAKLELCTVEDVSFVTWVTDRVAEGMDLVHQADDLGWREGQKVFTRYTFTAASAVYAMAMLDGAPVEVKKVAQAAKRAIAARLTESINDMERRNQRIIRDAQYQVHQAEKDFAWHMRVTVRNRDHFVLEAHLGATEDKTAKFPSYDFAHVQVTASCCIAEDRATATKYGVHVGELVAGWEVDHRPFVDPDVLYTSVGAAQDAATFALEAKVAEWRANEQEQGTWARAALENAGIKVEYNR